MTAFSKLKKSSGDLNRLKKEIEKQDAGARQTDERFWKPDIDKAGNGSAIIRFLPGPAVDGDEALPFVRYFSHAFQGNKGWYFENSLTTFKEADPCAEYNSYLWNLIDHKDSPHRVQARAQKRKLNYVSNILVISDPKHPENNGKIFLYEYGAQIFAKISEMMNPKHEGDEPINPFDFWSGCNFKMLIAKEEKKGSFPNYNSSKFDKQTQLFPTDEEIEALWNKEYSLLEFLDRKRFKTYDELKKRLDLVMGFDTSNPPTRQAIPTGTAKSRMDTPDDEDDDIEEQMKKFKNFGKDDDNIPF